MDNFCSWRPIKERTDVWKQKAAEAKEAKAVKILKSSSGSPLEKEKVVTAKKSEKVPVGVS